jgi:hypothetical protein
MSRVTDLLGLLPRPVKRTLAQVLSRTHLVNEERADFDPDQPNIHRKLLPFGQGLLIWVRPADSCPMEIKISGGHNHVGAKKDSPQDIWDRMPQASRDLLVKLGFAEKDGTPTVTKFGDVVPSSDYTSDFAREKFTGNKGYDVGKLVVDESQNFGPYGEARFGKPYGGW